MSRSFIWRVVVFGVSVAALVGSSPAEAQPPQGPPSARKIPGITAKDPYPNGCVDCHINHVDLKMDLRFSTLMKLWSEKVEPKLLAKAEASGPTRLVLKGKHPKPSGVLKDIPAKCFVCHGKGAKTSPPFADLIHNIHLTGGDENHFLTVFQGECTLCHKLDRKSGRLTMPSGPEK